MLVQISIDIEIEDSIFPLECQELTISVDDFKNDKNFIGSLCQARCRSAELNNKGEAEENDSLAKTWINVRVVKEVDGKFDLETRLNEFALFTAKKC